MLQWAKNSTGRCFPLEQPFGHTLNFSLIAFRRWFSWGPGWAAIAGLFSTGYFALDLTWLLTVAALWLLADPILGTLWELSVRQGVWRRVTRAQLPPAPPRGFFLPYARPDTPGGHLVLLLRRYRVWWRNRFWPQFGGQATTFGAGLALALLIGLALNPAIVWLVVLSVCLTLLAGLFPVDLAGPGGGRLQAVVQFLLPWLMGGWLGGLTLPALAMGVAFWAVYLGGLRLAGRHRRAGWLFYGGQLTAMLLLLALELMPGAAILAVLLITQALIKTAIDNPADLMQKSQLYLVIALLASGLSLGVL